MELLKTTKKQKSLLSELIYIVLNIGLAVGVLASVIVTEAVLVGILLVLLSKWRVFAVRPRYWFANIQANLVDTIVGVSVVVLMAQAIDVVAAQAVLAALYAIWLLFVKPRSKHIFITLQAGIAVFLGVNALMMVSFGWFATIVVLLMWLIGYSSARHLLGHYNEVHTSFYSLIWGFVFAQLGWITYHWTIAYSLPWGNLAIAQAALFAVLLSFVAERIYTSYAKNEEVVRSDVLPPVFFAGAIIAVVLVFFNDIGGAF